jgi:eukaryotic-like serine/threonine-protein kinase
MPLGPGTRLGPYEITAQIGAGGMGEVYRATDTALGRQVAIKVLPDAFAQDAERLVRFEREAKTLASLNHPHIAQIYGLERSNGVQALVMELVEGEDLSQRIARGSIPIEEALPIAKQIAEALEAAHEQGIIHRDLKPANVKVRPDGTVKVLDFGLAKLTEAAGSGRQTAGSASLSPTITSPAMMTGVGVLLGTAAYMAPEQARGKVADKRSDIWAFGCVLYEMLTGHGPFAGEDVSDTLANVLKRELDWSALPKDVPAAVCTLMQRCLAKDRLKRVSDISAAKFVLGELSQITSPPDPPTTVAAVTASRWRRQTVAAVVVTAALAAIVVAAAAWALRPTTRPPAVARFSFALPGDQTFSGTTGEVVGVSPDGTRIAYSANSRIFLGGVPMPSRRHKRAEFSNYDSTSLGVW